MAEGHGGWLNAWDDFRLVADEFRELDEERVLVLDQPRGRGQSSGSTSAEESHPCFTSPTAGRSTSPSLWDRDRALADLGLQE